MPINRSGNFAEKIIRIMTRLIDPAAAPRPPHQNLTGAIFLVKLLFTSLLLWPALPAGAQQPAATQYEFAAGLRNFHLPGIGPGFEPSELVVFAGVHQQLNRRQTVGLSLRLGYARGKYQGDALQAQLLLTLTPVIAQHIEAGFGLGAGYQLSYYPSQPLKWEGGQWGTGKTSKGLFHVPLQFSLGYRSLKSGHYAFRPYVGYQVQALFGYSPDLSVLPVSNALIGVRISALNNKRE